MGSVYVAGSLNMDVVAFGTKLPKPGETLLGSRVEFFPGGKGLNPSVAAARQGADVRLIASLGQDDFGDALFRFAQAEGVDLSLVQRSSQHPSGTAIILVAEDGQNSIVVVPGANALLSQDVVQSPAFLPHDVLLTLFEIPMPTVESFLDAGAKRGARTILSPSPAAPCSFLSLPDFLVLNETELAYYLEDREGLLDAEAGAKLLRSRPGQTVIVTLGAAGALAATEDGIVRVPGRKVEAVDATGAGDCFTGCLAARLAAGDELQAAMRYANLAASICVTRAGAAPSMPTMAEVDALAGQ